MHRLRRCLVRPTHQERQTQPMVWLVPRRVPRQWGRQLRQLPLLPPQLWWRRLLTLTMPTMLLAMRHP